VTRLCLDTSAYSHFMRGVESAVNAIRRARWVGVPIVVLGELRYGFRMGARPEANERLLMSFLAHPVVQVLELDERTADIYAEICTDLRRAGAPIPANDLWIASVAAREGATVLTFDAHFRRIARVATRLLEPAIGG
jgi:tRNA(fMet)-specific endonuclease VapC